MQSIIHDVKLSVYELNYMVISVYEKLYLGVSLHIGPDR